MAHHRAEELVGHHVLDEEGNSIGKVSRVYLDDRTGDATWASVNTGMFGMRETLVPLQGARPVQEDIQVPYDKSTVKDAPNIDAKDHISPEEEREVLEYYSAHGMPAQRSPQAGAPDTAGAPGGPGEQGKPGMAGMPDPRADAEDEEVVVRSEERVDIGVERREAGQARMRRHVDKEHFDTTVPVGHEELEVERRPITDPDQVTGDRPMEEGEETFTLYEERPVVTKHQVPVEEIHVRKREVTHEEHVAGERRSERVEFEDDEEDPKDR
ncbi:PRC and DUF2382 domain-containing protein [Nocardiopsis sp. N85]|uniref:PRC and DUF2382 domain-containing protein n=1 Tax=Nocardiopsis sp. N85 TaxID=3029400 RepID=UPI00237F6731|nr:PRC and DUF2382 domain-containing protein [Nocardiopsis sp. N85]MDE3723567.1 PRC and DUF2382 domain-containing protein [Nocardiopsis sp. N85]